MAQEQCSNASPLYVHSKCCAAHWELIYLPLTRKYRLVCEKCGKDSGLRIPGMGPGHCTCAVCDEKRKRHEKLHGN